MAIKNLFKLQSFQRNDATQLSSLSYLYIFVRVKL